VYTPAFRLRSFDSIPDEAKMRVLSALLDALTLANVAYLLKHPHTPNLYASGVRYEEEPLGRDEWQDIPDTIARRTGDCEDLACWRVAELRVRNRERATHAVSTSEIADPRTGKPVTTYHIRVVREDGAQEDPSRLLGMGGVTRSN
jgi:hypothetical protein